MSTREICMFLSILCKFGFLSKERSLYRRKKCISSYRSIGKGYMSFYFGKCRQLWILWENCRILSHKTRHHWGFGRVEWLRCISLCTTGMMYLQIRQLRWFIQEGNFQCMNFYPSWHTFCRWRELDTSSFQISLFRNCRRLNTAVN